MFKFLFAVALGLVANHAPAQVYKTDADNTLRMFGQMDPRSVMPLMRALATTDAKRVTILIDSPGGYVSAGMRLIQVMTAAKARGLTIDCVVTGNAMSMAFFMLAECSNRYALDGALLLWHPIRIGYMGVLTAEQATAIGKDLAEFEAPLTDKLVRTVGIDESLFLYHWRVETIHHASVLAKMAPRFRLKMVSEVRGVPVTSLFAPLRGVSDEQDKKPGGAGPRIEYIWTHPAWVTEPQ